MLLEEREAGPTGQNRNKAVFIRRTKYGEYDFVLGAEIKTHDSTEYEVLEVELYM